MTAVIPSPARQRGLSIIVAIFLIVVLAGLGAFMLVMSGAQQQTAALGVEEARAEAAALAGLDYGLYREANGGGADGACEAATTTLALTEGGLAGFSVTVQCSGVTQHTEAGTTFDVYTLVATASRGSYGSPYYVARTARTTAIIE